MAYSYNKRSVNKKPKGPYGANRISGKDYTDLQSDRAQTQDKHFELAEVVDVIRSSDHPDHKKNEDIGKAKVRRIYSEFNQDSSSLGFCLPLNGKFKSYPLEYELVLVAEFNGLPFYLRTAHWRTNPNQNAAAKISVNKIEGQGSSYSDNSNGVSGTAGEEINMEGEKFEVREDVMPLRHRTGDISVEGRFGNSIRVGRDSKMNPIMQLRVGQREEVTNAEYLTPFFEDINKDPTSIYMTSKETEFPLGPEETSAELEPATIDFGDHLTSAEDSPDSYNGAQILMASNRIVLNAKDKQIMGFSKGETNWVTLKNFTFDAKKKIKSFSKEKTEHKSGGDFDVLPEGNIHLTTDSESEPVARGKQTVDRLQELIQTLIQETHPTPVGPTSPPIQASQYQKTLQKILQTIRSERVFLDEG